MCVLARAPSARAKTRLAADVGEVAADRIYRAMLIDLFANLAGGLSISVYLDGDPSEFRAASGWQGRIRPQAAGDLGRRIGGAIDDSWAEGADQVVVIGSDAPQVDAQLIGRAASRLATCDVVVGPAADGGFYLLAVARRTGHRQLLSHIEWGTATVLKSLERNAQSGGVVLCSIEELMDLDRQADLQRFIQSEQSRHCPAVCAASARA